MYKLYTNKYRHFERNKVKPRNLIDKEISPLVLLGRDDRQTSKRYAFTLAEVLITLMAIGIVGALTIPGFIAEHQKTVFVESLKKAYAAGNQAVKKLAFEKCGTNDLSCFFSGTPSYTTIGNAFAAQYSLNKNCKTNGKGCFVAQDWNYTGTPDVMENEGGAYYSFQTADSMGIVLKQLYANCGLDAALTENAPTKKVCGELWVDVNGTKGPNRLGRDAFRFYITTNNGALLYPYGGRETNPNKTGTDARGGNMYWNYNNASYCGNNANKRGYFCAGRVMEKGWEIDYWDE